MKNIILIDLSSFGLDPIMKIDDVYLAALVVDSKDQVEYAKEKYGDRIGNIYYRTSVATNVEFLNLNKNDYSLSYDDIEKYRTAQLKVEQYLSREVLDYNEQQYRYYTGLQYWLGIFNKYKIDAVISMHTEHGGVWDSIPLEVAKINNIPVFIQEVMLSNYEKSCYSLRNLNNGKIVNLREITDKIVDFDANDYIFSKKVLDLNKKRRFNINRKWLKERWKDSLPRMFWKYLRYESRSLFLSKEEKFNKRNEEFQQWHNVSPKQLFFNNIYIRNLEKLYQQISTEIDFKNNSEKYVFYALHFEPEASVMNRVILSNQLYIIRMISESLPEGWKLYVKEHPLQFKLKDLLLYFIKTIPYFRTEGFYKRILELGNVRLISLKNSSEELINNAQATATICGTVTIESIVKKKPTLLFGENLTILAKLKDVFCIRSKQNIIDALEKIKTGFNPDYGDLQSLLSEYVYESKTQEFFRQFGEKDYLTDIFSGIIHDAQKYAK